MSIEDQLKPCKWTLYQDEFRPSGAYSYTINACDRFCTKFKVSRHWQEPNKFDYDGICPCTYKSQTYDGDTEKWIDLNDPARCGPPPICRTVSWNRAIQAIEISEGEYNDDD